MTGLFNLRTRLALGVAALILVSLGSVYYLSTLITHDVSGGGSRSSLSGTEARVMANWNREHKLLSGKLYKAIFDPANTVQLRAGGADDLLLRLTLTLGVHQAWLVDTDNEVTAQAGERTGLSGSLDAMKLASDARTTGQANGIITFENKAALAAAVRIGTVPSKPILVVAQAINSDMARSLTEISGAQISYVKFATGGAVTNLGSQVSAAMASELTQKIRDLAAVGVKSSKDFSVADRAVRLRMLHQTDDGNVYMSMMPSASPIAAKVNNFQYYVGVIAAIGLAVALIGGLLFGSRLTATLTDLTFATQQVSTGQYDNMVQVRSRDELGRYVESFNLLAQTLKQRETKLLQGAYRDTVTGLPSRPLFENHLVEAVTKARNRSGSMALIMVTVDRLREVNESLGRKASDAMISEIADRIRRSLKTSQPGGQEIAIEQSCFVARLATYEFGIIVPNCDQEQSVAVAGKLSEVVARRVEFEGQSVLPGGQIGIAVYPDHGVDPGGLVYSADIAAAHADEELDGVALFDPSYEVDRETSLAMLGELAQALEHDELHIAMQPKVGLSKQGTLMAEALMRWEHPERGPQNPGEFVPFAEKTGFITQLTNWMIDSSLQIAAAYMAQGVPMTICVNLSPRDLGSPEFTTYVVERLRAHKLRGSALTLEITEAAIMDGSPVVRQNLDVLWRLGVKIAIDDFGSGYASLEQLRALPISYLKIDRQYINGLVNDKASQIMVKSAIALGHVLEVEVVAEGVETKEQLEALRSLGCDQAQGYFISKPLPSDEFEAWVRNHSSNFGVDSSNISDAPIKVDGSDAQIAAMPASATQPAKGRTAPAAAAAQTEVAETESETEDALASLDFDIDGPGQSQTRLVRYLESPVKACYSQAFTFLFVASLALRTY